MTQLEARQLLQTCQNLNPQNLGFITRLKQLSAMIEVIHPDDWQSYQWLAGKKLSQGSHG